jgi:hypothetical protein
MKSISLKRRLFALALLAAFVATVFAPVRQAEAAGWPWNPSPSTTHFDGGYTTNNVNWNGGPQ